MTKLTKYKFCQLYSMSSGISSKPEQAGHGAPFASFSTIFNNYFLPETLPDRMDTSEKEQETYSIKEGDIFLTRTSETIDELGMSCVALKNYRTATYSGFAKRLRPLQNDITYAKYMGFYLRSKFFRKTMTNNAVLTLRASLNEEIFSYLNLILPDFNTQKKSGDFLHLLNTKIELNNRINAELEGMAKTLYNYWFVQFDFPNAEGKPYKTSGGKMVWNEELKREIPEGWEVKSLLDIAEYTNGLPCQKYRPVDENVLRVIKIREMHEGFSSDTELVRADIPEKAIIENGDILFSWSASLEVQLWSKGRGALNQHIFKVTSTKYPKTFFYFQLVNYLEHFKMMAENRKTTMGHITQEHLTQSRIATPKTVGLTLKLEAIIEPIFSKITNNDIENQRLSSLRDWLLPMLMNGQVTVGSVSQIEAENPAVAQPETLFIADNKKAFAKQVLGGKIVSLFQNDPHFSNIKFQKIQYLAEHIAEVDLNWNYYYQAAGPYDNVYMHTITEKLKTAHWFEKRDSKYVPLAKQEQVDRYYQGFFNPVVNRLDQLFSLMANMTDIDAEIIATLYAVWNNRLILNQPVSEELLIEDFYNWSDRKLLYTQEQLQKGLQWMRTNGIVPNGFGKEMKRAREKVK